MCCVCLWHGGLLVRQEVQLVQERLQIEQWPLRQDLLSRRLLPHGISTGHPLALHQLKGAADASVAAPSAFLPNACAVCLSLFFTLAAMQLNALLQHEHGGCRQAPPAMPSFVLPPVQPRSSRVWPAPLLHSASAFVLKTACVRFHVLNKQPTSQGRDALMCCGIPRAAPRRAAPPGQHSFAL